MKTYYFDCPSCGNDQEFYRTREAPSGGTGCLILLLGGILPALLFCGYKFRRIQCAKCGYIFRQPPIPYSPIARTAISIGILIPVISILVGYAITAFPSLKEIIPGSKFFTWFEIILKEHTAFAASIIFTYIILTIFFSILTAVIDNFTYHRPMRRDIPYKPINKNPNNTSLENNQN